MISERISHYNYEIIVLSSVLVCNILINFNDINTSIHAIKANKSKEPCLTFAKLSSYCEPIIYDYPAIWFDIYFRYTQAIIRFICYHNQIQWKYQFGTIFGQFYWQKKHSCLFIQIWVEKRTNNITIEMLFWIWNWKKSDKRGFI